MAKAKKSSTPARGRATASERETIKKGNATKKAVGADFVNESTGVRETFDDLAGTRTGSRAYGDAQRAAKADWQDSERKAAAKRGVAPTNAEAAANIAKNRENKKAAAAHAKRSAESFKNLEDDPIIPATPHQKRTIRAHQEEYDNPRTNPKRREVLRGSIGKLMQLGGATEGMSHTACQTPGCRPDGGTRGNATSDVVCEDCLGAGDLAGATYTGAISARTERRNSARNAELKNGMGQGQGAA